MTVNEAKRDAKFRLSQAGISYEKVTGRPPDATIPADAATLIVIHNPGPGWERVFKNLPKPSQGGYLVKVH